MKVPKEHGRPIYGYFIPWKTHCFVGYLTPFVGVLLSSALAVMLWGCFWGYEVLEWLYFWWVDKAPDKIHADVLEYSVPFTVSVLVLLVLRLAFGLP